MRTLILFLVLCGATQAQDFTKRYGNNTYRNDGSLYKSRYGRTTEYYRADGSYRGSSQRFGNTRYYNYFPQEQNYFPQTQLPSMRSYGPRLEGFEFPEIKAPKFPR